MSINSDIVDSLASSIRYVVDEALKGLNYANIRFGSVESIDEANHTCSIRFNEDHIMSEVMISNGVPVSVGDMVALVLNKGNKDMVGVVVANLDNASTSDGSTSAGSTPDLSVYATNADNHGVYQDVTWKRRDGTVYAKSSLSGASYDTLTFVKYDGDGVSVLKTVKWALLFDDNNNIVTKELIE